VQQKRVVPGNLKECILGHLFGDVNFRDLVPLDSMVFTFGTWSPTARVPPWLHLRFMLLGGTVVAAVTTALGRAPAPAAAQAP
jgi:hypothetical protein